MKARKILSVIVALAMIMGTMSFTAFADEPTVSYAEEFYNAVKDAQPGDVINLTESVTYDVWNAIADKNGITINGNGNTITVNEKVFSNGNGGALLRKASNLTINDLNVVLPAQPTAEMERLAIMDSGVLNNVTVTGGSFAVSIVGNGNVTIYNCNFSGIDGWAIETEGKAKEASLTISNSTFDEKAVILRGENNTFTGNTITSTEKIEGVNILGASVVSGNDFGKSILGIYSVSDVEVKIEKNTIDFVKFAVYQNGEDYSNVTVENNTLSDEVVAEMNDKLDEKVVSVEPTVKVNDKGYYDLADAVKALKEGDTLKLSTGEYEGFEVLADNVTITGMTEDAEITINSTSDTAFIGVGGDNVTIKGIKFIIPEEVGGNKAWLASVIGFASSQYNYGGVEPDGWDVIDCGFVQEGNELGIAIFNCNNFTVDGCTFENFATGITAMGDGSALGTVAITGNTFTKVNEPVNVYWGQPGNEDEGSIAITGNTFASAKDADEIKISVDDYASRIKGTSGIDSIDISGNTFNAATEVVLVDTAADVSASVEEALTDVENVVLDNKYNAVARIGNDKYFTSLDTALAAAENEDVIDLLGNEVELTGTLNADNNITIKNGTLDATGVEFTSGFGVLVDEGEAITFEDVDFVLDNAKAYQGFFYNEGTVTFNGGSVVAEGTDAPAIFHGGENETAGTFVINGTEITLSKLENGEEGGRGFLYLTLDIDDATITMTELSDNAMRNVSGTIDNSAITVDGAEYGIKNKDYDGVLTVTNSEITITNTENGDGNVGIYLNAVDDLVADENSVINASICVAPAEEGSEPTIYYALVFAESNLPSVNELAGTVIDLADYVPTLDGYTFSGWYADAELTEEIDTVTLDENITVYAAWTKKRTTGTSGGGLQAGGDTSNKGADDLGQKDNEDDKTTEQTPVTPVTPAAHPFADVNSGDWYNAAVEYVYKNGLMNGTAADKFSPNATLTRAMLVTVLYRAEGSPATNKSIPFGDIDMGAYYADAVIWAKQNGIVNGVTENTFAPNANINREQIAAIIYRYAQYKGYNVMMTAELTGYTDAKSISEYAVDAMKYAVGANIINGKTATTVNPADFATRAELATILMRLIESNK